MRRGELWWARVPIRGSGAKKRPMLIVSDDAFNRNDRYPKVMAVHVTSVRRMRGPYDWEVDLPRGTAGLERPSIAKCGEIYTLWKDKLDGPPATIPRSIMTRIDRALAVALSLPIPP
jgi:mRNA-degrading endonuclease toxin of MazEF toxin-antitoxin module